MDGSVVEIRAIWERRWWSRFDKGIMTDWGNLPDWLTGIWQHRRTGEVRVRTRTCGWVLDCHLLSLGDHMPMPLYRMGTKGNMYSTKN